MNYVHFPAQNTYYEIEYMNIYPIADGAEMIYLTQHELVYQLGVEEMHYQLYVDLCAPSIIQLLINGMVKWTAREGMIYDRIYHMIKLANNQPEVLLRRLAIGMKKLILAISSNNNVVDEGMDTLLKPLMKH